MTHVTDAPASAAAIAGERFSRSRIPVRPALAGSEKADRIRQRGMRAARLADILSDVVTHSAHPDVCAEWLAKRHSISVSYVRRLFEFADTSLSEFLLATRLGKARSLLSRPEHDHQTVCSIAYSVGFSDLSYFNRTFKQAFGVTPSDLRSRRHDAATCDGPH